MHMTIRAIVYAENKNNAVSQAEGVFTRLVERDTFDYYSLFGEGAEDIWGDRIVASKYKTKEGKKLVKDGWDFTYRDTKEYFKKVKKILKKYKNVDDFLDGDTFDRWYLYKLGAYEGSSLWLYDDDGSGIRDEKHLNNVLDKWKHLYEDKNINNPYKNKDIWVVPADVHF